MTMAATLDRLRQELRRLSLGTREDEKPDGIGTVRIIAKCRDPESVCAHAKEVLAIVTQTSLDRWPTEEQWKALLPKWFVDACAPPMTKAEEEHALKRWRRLSPTERAKVEEETPWTLLDLLHWFRPEERQWYWWDARPKDSSTLVVAIEVDGWPFPWGSLKWLLRAAGARQVEAEE